MKILLPIDIFKDEKKEYIHTRTSFYKRRYLVYLFFEKKVGGDGDSAGTLAYNKGWKIIDDSYAFSDAIRIVFLNTGKLVKFY